MRNLLKHAGAPATSIKHLPEIIDTWRICRMSKRPQWDILFYKKSMLSH